MEGDDSAENLRNRAASVAKSFNSMRQEGTLTVEIKGHVKALKIKMLLAADFQFFKAVMNMSKYTSAVWCMCQLDSLFKHPGTPLQTWKEVKNGALNIAPIVKLRCFAR